MVQHLANGPKSVAQELFDQLANQQVSVATTTAPGTVQPDGTNITVDGSGKINVNQSMGLFKKASGTFASGTSQVVTDAFCTATSLVTVIVTSGSPAGAWSVVSAAGSFTITSTAAETNIGFDYYIQKAVGG